MGQGWIKVNRQIQDHWVWDDKPFSKGQAWIDLILLANYRSTKSLYKNDVIENKKGDVIISISKLAKRWGWSRKKTNFFIRQLEKENMVTTNITTNRTTISIVKYGLYQDRGTTKDTTEDTARVTTEEQRAHTSKEVKKDKKDKSINNNNKYINNNNLSFSLSDGGEREKERETMKRKVRQQIEYDLACSRYDVGLVDDAVDIMTDVFLSDSQRIRVNRSWEPVELVRERLSAITLEHLGYVFISLKENTSKKANLKNYMITCLFNAPVTMHTYFKDRVQRDLKEGAFIEA